MENELEVSKRKIRETEELNKRLYKNLRLFFSLFQIPLIYFPERPSEI